MDKCAAADTSQIMLPELFGGGECAAEETRALSVWLLDMLNKVPAESDAAPVPPFSVVRLAFEMLRHHLADPAVARSCMAVLARAYSPAKGKFCDDDLRLILAVCQWSAFDGDVDMARAAATVFARHAGGVSCLSLDTLPSLLVWHAEAMAHHAADALVVRKCASFFDKASYLDQQVSEVPWPHEVLALLMAALARHADDVKVVRNCLGCWSNLAEHAECETKHLLWHSTLAPVLRAMQHHIGDRVVAYRSAKGFFELALHMHAIPKLQLMKAVPLCLAAMAFHAEHKTFVDECAGFLSEACEVFDEYAADLMDVVPVLLDVLARYPDNRDLALTCVKAFVRLAKHPPNRMALMAAAPAVGAAAARHRAAAARHSGGTDNCLLDSAREFFSALAQHASMLSEATPQ